MSKLVVDSLPYYGDVCPLEQPGSDLDCETWLSRADVEKHRSDPSVCPKYWGKYFVCSNENPRECARLIELKKALEHLDD